MVRKYYLFAISILFFFLIPNEIGCQEPPPHPIIIDATAQGLSFGAFYHGLTGGTVIIDPSGSRSATGDVVLLLLGYSFSAVLFEVYADPGTVISILNGPDIQLFGTPSGSMSLHLGSSNPPSPFVVTSPYSIATPLYLGGTLIVGNSAANPPGSYTGTFYITLIQE